MLRCAELSLPVRLLLSYLRSLSQDYQHCGWSNNLEYELWRIIESNQATRLWPLSSQEITDLRTLRELAGCWVRRRDIDEILAEYKLTRWEELQNNKFQIPENKWYQLYSRDEWETVMMERTL